MQLLLSLARRAMPSRRPAAAVLAGLLAAGAAPAWATPAEGLPLGAWLFACVALVLVGLFAYLAGLRGRRPVTPVTPITPDVATAPAGSTATLHALLQAEPGEVRLCQRAHTGAPWELVAAHPALPAGPAFAGLPPAVVSLAEQLAADASAEADGWALRRSGSGADERLVLRQVSAGNADEQAAFSFTVSHDLRAPLRVVDGFARILKEDYGRQLDRIGNDHVDRVLGAAARMNAMIDAMLTLARLSTQPLARQPVNLSQLAAYVVDDLKRNAPERRVDMLIEPDLQAHGDPTLLRQVLDNLLANAWKYSARCAQARITFTSADHGGRRVFEVRDNGAGFDMRSADRLFGLFQRLHSANDFPGTGVGLASVQRIVRRHGGEIWAEGEPGHGARFCFTLGP